MLNISLLQIHMWLGLLLNRIFFPMFQIEFEVNLDIEGLVLPPKQFGILNMETIDIKEEPLDQRSNNRLIDESKKSGEFPMVHERMNSFSFATVPVHYHLQLQANSKKMAQKNRCYF